VPNTVASETFVKDRFFLMENHDFRFVSSKSQPDGGTTPTRFAWKEYRLLLYSGLIGIVGGLGAQLFVWLLNLAERLLLVGLAGYQPPEPGTLNPQPVIGPWGLWLIPVVTTLGGLLSGMLVYTFAPEAEGHGTDAAVEAFTSKAAGLDPSCR
jgi:H+/Cl- antiporter ClcA